jgi:enoyl-CoA hydratase
MANDIVHWELSDGVALVRMDDGKANAIGPTLLAALNEALDRAEKEAKAVVLSGRPGRFCAGFDLKIMMSSPEAAFALVGGASETFLRLYAHPQPLVVACTGHAMAGGVLLVACGDERIGAQGDFKIGLNEVAIGIPLPVLAHELARDRVEPREFIRATLQAKLYTPDEALRAGWVDRVVEPERVEEEAIAAAKKLAALSAKPYALTKHSLRRDTIRRIRDSLESNMAELGQGMR